MTDAAFLEFVSDCVRSLEAQEYRDRAAVTRVYRASLQMRSIAHRARRENEMAWLLAQAAGAADEIASELEAWSLFVASSVGVGR